MSEATVLIRWSMLFLSPQANCRGKNKIHSVASCSINSLSLSPFLCVFRFLTLFCNHSARTGVTCVLVKSNLLDLLSPFMPSHLSDCVAKLLVI